MVGIEHYSLSMVSIDTCLKSIPFRLMPVKKQKKQKKQRVDIQM
jgi:hypothetical protein